MWLEMSRDDMHGGDGWGFKECLWSPTRTRSTEKAPSRAWAYWELLPRVHANDVVVHLRGENKEAELVGYSIADADGYETTSRPPHAGQWDYASSFYRVPLIDFVPFAQPIRVYDIFSERNEDLRAHYLANRLKKKAKLQYQLLFFVVQGDRLQCQNGAYLSEFSTLLANIVFGPAFAGQASSKPMKAVSIKTGEQVAQIKARIGQAEFSDEVRENYGGRCCFPGCEVAEHGLLVGAHIARWADAEHLRGEVSNGLCLCLFHDKLFERGVFTLTPDHRIAINEPKLQSSPWSHANIAPFSGKVIKSGGVLPGAEPLKKHWERIGFTPAPGGS
jgi:putative restriction endonuclease